MQTDGWIVTVSVRKRQTGCPVDVIILPSCNRALQWWCRKCGRKWWNRSILDIFFSENSVSSMLTDYNQFLSKNCRGLEEPHVQTNPYVWIFWYFFWMASKTCVSTGAGYIWKLLTLFQMIASSQGERTMGGTEATKFHKVLLHGPALYYIGSKSTMSQQTAIRLSYCWF